MVAWCVGRKYHHIIGINLNGVGIKMTCSVITGRKIYAVGSGSDKDGASNVLFDQKSTKTVSHFIHVEPCQAIQFSTFGLPDGAKLTLHRVLPAGGQMPQGTGCICDHEEGYGIVVSASEPLKIDCSPVELTNCNNVLYLTIPGSYMLRLNEERYLGQFWAFADAMECCCLPEGLVIGNRKGGGYVGT